MHSTRPDDEFWYMRYTGPQQAHKALNVFRGILEGIRSDAHANIHEMTSLKNWRDENRKLLSRQPFIEIDTYLAEALANDRLDDEEVEDLIHLCQRVGEESLYFDEATSRMQILHGMMRGIAMDGEISKGELDGLRDWMADNDDMSSMWPFAEVFSVIVEVLRDGKIDQREHEFLLKFFGDFSGNGSRSERLPGEVPVTLMGICETGVDIDFDGHEFCVTGASARFTRKSLEDRIIRMGGRIGATVTKRLRYLVVCDNGNKAWAFSAYGRKVERAMECRKAGQRLSIVSEFDLLDAMVE